MSGGGGQPLGRPTDGSGANLYDAIVGGQTTEIVPERAPKLRAHSVGTLKELRGIRGDIVGNAGPSATVLSGYTTALDGGQGVFVWDPTSTAGDDGGLTVCQVAGVDTGRWRRLVFSGGNISVPPTTGRLLRISYVTAGTSLASAAGAVSARIRGQACGGGGGGGAAAGGRISAGAGGAAGGAWEFRTTTIPATWAFNGGTPGTGGSTLGTDGTAGSNLTFSDGVTTVTAFGGPGGPGDSSGLAHCIQGGVAPAQSTNGSINASGAPGGPGINVDSAGNGVSGAGGSTPFGAGGGGMAGSNGALDATGFGGGGGGARGGFGAVGQAGGAGGGWCLVIEEYA